MTKNNTINGNYIAALDIGTSKVVCLIGSISDSHSIEIVAMGSYPSSGLKKGVVVNIDATTDAIQKSIEQAKNSFEGKIKNVFVGIAGNHIKSLNSHGIVGIKDKEVTQLDIEKVIDAAQAVAIPSDQRVLHVLPQEFVIDDQDAIREPLGMSGVRLESHVHLVTCANNAIQNIEKCVKRCGIGIDGFVLEQLASSYSILSNDEKELGVCIVDIGGGTTDIAIFNNGSICFTGVIPIAGDQVTSDIAVALRTPTPQAEELKQKFGCAVSEFTNGEAIIKNLKNVTDKEIILDIGPQTIEKINGVIDKSKTVLWNGPAGYFENKNFSKGTVSIAKKISFKTKTNSLISIIGGGDTISAIKNNSLELNFTHLSTAGGAFLEYIEGKNLPGIEVLK